MWDPDRIELYVLVTGWNRNSCYAMCDNTIKATNDWKKSTVLYGGVQWSDAVNSIEPKISRMILLVLLSFLIFSVLTGIILCTLALTT